MISSLGSVVGEGVADEEVEDIEVPLEVEVPLLAEADEEVDRVVEAVNVDELVDEVEVGVLETEELVVEVLEIEVEVVLGVVLFGEA